MNLVSLSPFDNELFELIRTDEREQMQGVDVWVSWDEGRSTSKLFSKEQPVAHIADENVFHEGEFLRTANSWFNIQPGQCRKFKIVECAE